MPSKEPQFISISSWTIVRFFAILLGVAALYLIRDIIAALIFAIIVASAIEPAIEWLKERRIPRILGVILIYLGIAIIFVFLVYLVLPLFVEEFRTLVSSFPELQKRVLQGISSATTLPVFSFFSENLQGFLDVPSDFFSKFGGGVTDFATNVFGGVLSFFLIVIFSFYLATQERGIENFLRLISPVSYEPYIVDLWERSQKKLGRWFRSQLLLGAVVGVLIFFGLTFLRVDHALFFAALAAVFEIIPVVGPILAAVPAVGSSLFISPLTGIFVMILYIMVQQMESHIIVPVVMRKTVGLSPLVVVLALLIGAKVGGVFGIILAVPITAIFAEFIGDWDKKKRAIMPE